MEVIEEELIEMETELGLKGYIYIVVADSRSRRKQKNKDMVETK